MINGKFVENEVLAILEKMAKGNLEDLRKNLMVVDDCGNTTDGMDECDKASQMIKCTKEKAPDILMGVVYEMEKSISQSETIQETVPLPPSPRQCATNYTCVLDPKLRDAFEAANTTQPLVNGTAGFMVDFNCGKKYLSSGGSGYNFTYANEMCCKYGLRMATLDTISKLDCAINSSTYASTHRVCPYWIAASWLPNQTSPQWCYSSAPISNLLLTIPAATSVDPLKPFMIINYASKSLTVSPVMNSAHMLCEEY
ncbi:uncharacterized protein LOC132204614 [Neocloeon triangulifer]|uniref:uncharacterized protein LOC132204614 n=1 Tax=Neocloeon triangulifer TaxID=2078957 RepID=UPI00286FA9A4|nr:uncharacterized protein LOC132204614 [Neocloeon triangulifer]